MNITAMDGSNRKMPVWDNILEWAIFALEYGHGSLFLHFIYQS